jgi:hypothetical protein
MRFHHGALLRCLAGVAGGGVFGVGRDGRGGCARNSDVSGRACFGSDRTTGIIPVSSTKCLFSPGGVGEVMRERVLRCLVLVKLTNGENALMVAHRVENPFDRLPQGL